MWKQIQDYFTWFGIYRFYYNANQYCTWIVSYKKNLRLKHKLLIITIKIYGI